MSFTHLHTHSHYSLLDGLASPEELVVKAKKLGQTTIALTDHGNMSGIFEFYQACMKHDIKPILGYEAYVAPKSRHDKKAKKGEKTSDHLVLLAKDITGYHNLLQLATIAYTEGFYYKPRIDYEMLGIHKDGLICMSACVAGAIPRAILAEDMQRVKLHVTTLRRLFGDDFYLEVQDHGIEEQAITNKWITDNHADIKVVATNDAHYCEPYDARVHDVLLAIGTRKDIYRKDAFKFSTDQFYMKSEGEMRDLFCGEFIDTTQEIADKCNVVIDTTTKRGILDKDAAVSLLKTTCQERVQGFPQKYKERCEYEIDAICKTDYAEYIMVVADFIQFSKAIGIPIGAGRGSSASSLVCYLLGITEIDPIAHGLLFERFINIERIAPPDIDIDVCQARRGELIAYLKSAYGEDNVAQIITFGTLQAKAAVKEACGALAISVTIAGSMSKAIGEHFEGDIHDVLKIKGIQDILKNKLTPAQRNEFIYVLPKLEGRLRSASTHAAGVVVSDEKLINIVPLCKKTSSDELLTQYDMHGVEALGLLKFDILGLKTLTIIAETCDHYGLVASEIPLDDQYVYRMLSNGETHGVFQYSAWGYTKFIKRMRPSTFNHLVDLGALYRPGPLNSGMADTYIDRMKYGTSSSDNNLDDILIDTYGIILYQEQVMKICQRIAGFSMNEADTMRKAIGKKDADLMAEVIAQFKFCAINNMGHTQDYIDDLCDRLVTFARYGWNKAHAVSYALLSYQTAYLKYLYSTGFYCALLNSDLKDAKRLALTHKDALRYKIEFERPHVNISDTRYKVHNGCIYEGLQSLPGLGSRACEAIIEERNTHGNFNNAEDFRIRMPSTAVNKPAFSVLVENGAFL